MNRRWKTGAFLSLLMLCLCLCHGLLAGGLAEGGHSLLGSWAYEYKPEEAVLTLREDGTARYGNKEWTWEEEEKGFLTMKDTEGNHFRLRYDLSGEKPAIYPRTVYHRGKTVEGQGGLIGIWEGDQDGSSFVFTPAGYFLEDSVFSGNFTVNKEEGSFLLHYGDAFEDTVCYFSIEDEKLTVEYPWVIVPAQN